MYGQLVEMDVLSHAPLVQVNGLCFDHDFYFRPVELYITSFEIVIWIRSLSSSPLRLLMLLCLSRLCIFSLVCAPSPYV